MALWSHMRRRPLLLVFIILVIISFGLFTRRGTISDLPALSGKTHHGPGKHWSSFADISTLFVFGDSWSSLGVKLCDSYEATEANHYAKPDFSGFITTTNGPNWVGYLSHVFNRTVINTYDLAIPGSTVDNDFVKGWADHDLKYGIQQLIDPVRRCQLLPKTWDPATSLFAVFLGMNDVIACFAEFGCDIYSIPIPEIFKSYTKSIEKLYAAGARNFLLLNGPPVTAAAALDLLSSDQLTKAQFKATKSFNEHHHRLAEHLRTNFEDTTVFEFDVWGLFQKIYFSPKEVPDVAIYKNTTGMCLFYNPLQWPNGREPTQAEIDLCGGLRPEEYMWNSPAHVTWPAHKAIARGVVDILDMYGK